MSNEIEERECLDATWTTGRYQVVHCMECECNEIINNWRSNCGSVFQVTTESAGRNMIKIR